MSERASHLQSSGKGFRISEIALVPRPDVEASRLLCLVCCEVDGRKEQKKESAYDDGNLAHNALNTSVTATMRTTEGYHKIRALQVVDVRTGVSYQPTSWRSRRQDQPDGF